MGKPFIDKLAYIYLQGGQVPMSLSHGRDTWYIPGGKRKRGGSESGQEAPGVKIYDPIMVPHTV